MHTKLAGAVLLGKTFRAGAAALCRSAAVHCIPGWHIEIQQGQVSLGAVSLKNCLDREALAPPLTKSVVWI